MDDACDITILKNQVDNGNEVIAQQRNNEREETEKVNNDDNKLSMNVHITNVVKYWFVLIILGFIGMGVCVILPYTVDHGVLEYICTNGHYGILDYVGDWCPLGIGWKICFVISLVLMTVGVIKTYVKKATDAKTVKRRRIAVGIVVVILAVILILWIALSQGTEVNADIIIIGR